MVAIPSGVSDAGIPRFTQLINKSNQFNLRTKRYSEANIQSMKLNSDQYKLIEITLKDKFGSYGQISSIILKKNGEVAFVDTWVMSCRVLKRGVENFALGLMIEAASVWGCKVLLGEYIATAKNILVQNLYLELGFKKIIESMPLIPQFEGTVYARNIEEFDQLKTNNWISFDQAQVKY